MKTIYTINKVVLIANLILYITFYGGLLFQMVTGAVQVMSFIIYLCLWKRLDTNLHKHFLIYGICMLTILSSYFFITTMTDWFYLFPIITSAVLAVYFFLITKWQKEYWIQIQSDKKTKTLVIN